MMMINCGPKDCTTGSKVKPGDYVILFGEGGPSLKDAAGQLTTAQSDLTCDFMRRIEKHYINFPEPLADRRRSSLKALQAAVHMISLCPTQVVPTPSSPSKGGGMKEPSTRVV